MRLRGLYACWDCYGLPGFRGAWDCYVKNPGRKKPSGPLDPPPPSVRNFCRALFVASRAVLSWQLGNVLAAEFSGANTYGNSYMSICECPRRLTRSRWQAKNFFRATAHFNLPRHARTPVISTNTSTAARNWPGLRVHHSRLPSSQSVMAMARRDRGDGLRKSRQRGQRHWFRLFVSFLTLELPK